MNSKDTVVWFAAIGFMTFVIAAFGVWYMKPYQPSSFEKGVALLKKNKYVLNKIGSYSSHSWKHTELPDEGANPATFQVSLKGSDAEIFLTCTVSKTNKGL